MACLNLKRVNAALAAEKIPLQLWKGEGYLYFLYDKAGRYETKSVYVCYLNDLPLERWLEEARDFIKELEE